MKSKRNRNDEDLSLQKHQIYAFLKEKKQLRNGKVHSFEPANLRTIGILANIMMNVKWSKK